MTFKQRLAEARIVLAPGIYDALSALIAAVSGLLIAPLTTVYYDTGFLIGLKGFVAARCGSPVIVTAEDGDAAHYLGDDYPFYSRSVAAADLEMAMATAPSTCGAARRT